MEEMTRKITSRKFWISVAAFLGSIAVSISGIATGEKWVTIVGTVCGVLSAAVYAACEAAVDASNKGVHMILPYDTDDDTEWTDGGRMITDPEELKKELEKEKEDGEC